MLDLGLKGMTAEGSQSGDHGCVTKSEMSQQVGNESAKSEMARDMTEKHKVKTIEDLVNMTIEDNPGPEINCTGRKPRGNSCKDKAQELLTRINKAGTPSKKHREDTTCGTHHRE